MLRVITDNEESLTLAKTYKPIIYQEWQDIRDFLTPLMFKTVNGESILTDERQQLLDIIEEIKKPTLYYKAMEDQYWWYICYVVYHPWDWSDHPIGFIRKMDSHRHDTESILLRIERSRPLFGRRGIGICTVHHSSFIFKRHSDRQVYIQPQGHGIKPLEPKMLKEDRNFIRYTNYDFVNWANIKKPEWEKLRQKLKGVNLPDKQFDGQMNLRFRNRGEDNHRPGDIWKRPDALFRQAAIMNRI